MRQRFPKEKVFVPAAAHLARAGGSPDLIGRRVGELRPASPKRLAYEGHTLIGHVQFH